MPSLPERYRTAPATARELEERRQSVLDRLTEAFAADLVPIEEYESRVGRAQNARGTEELEESLAGLEPAAGAVPKAAYPGRPARSQLTAVADFGPGQSSLVCVMGDRQMTGDWLSGDKVDSFTLMGSTKLDLRDAVLPPGRLKIDAFCLMGEIKIIVPRGLPVRLNAFPFMGEARLGRDVGSRVEPGRPYVEVSGFAMMGSIVVVAAD